MRCAEVQWSKNFGGYAAFCMEFIFGKYALGTLSDYFLSFSLQLKFRWEYARLTFSCFQKWIMIKFVMTLNSSVLYITYIVQLFFNCDCM